MVTGMSRPSRSDAASDPRCSSPPFSAARRAAVGAIRVVLAAVLLAGAIPTGAAPATPGGRLATAAAEALPGDARLWQAIATQINALRAAAARCTDPLAARPADSEAVGQALRPTLRPHPALAQAALRQARQMAVAMRVAHRADDGTTVRERASDAGYAWKVIGENLAAGQRDVAEVVAQWFASPSHCDNLLDARFTEFGVARIPAQRPGDPYGQYWALVLGSPRTSSR